MNKYFFVIKKFKQYLDIKYRKVGGNEYVTRKYAFTTLKYFDKELGI